MANVSPQEFEQLWVQNGGPRNVAAVMAALMMQQSGGDPTSVNSSDPQGSYGLLQVNRAAHPDIVAQFGGTNGLLDAVNNVKAAVELYKADGLAPWATVNTYDAQGQVTGTTENPVVAAYQKGQDPMAAVSQSASSASTTGGASQASIPASTFAPPIAGADVTNFHGFDLSAIPQNELGNAEQAIQKYVSDPGYAQQINQRISQDFNYQLNWVSKVPNAKQVEGVLIWASTSLDPSTAAGKNQFQSAISNTDWWKTTNANQRSWEQALVSDPAQAHNALVQAQDKVLATANQIGVKLTKTELDSIANMYAANSYVQSGTLGSSSGTSAEWLDQAVIGAITKKQQTGTTDFANQTQGFTNPSDLTGITSNLYQQFLQTAQNYLLYNPNDPTKSLLSTQDILRDVQNALSTYTGTGASGQINQFESGALNQFTEQVKQQAKSVYPGMSTLIDQGTQPLSYITPLANNVASTLGMSQGQINVMDPQWNWLINSTGKDGSVGPVTMDQALQKVTSPTFSWTDPNGQRMTYLQTSSGQQIQNQLAQQFQSAFGKAA